MMIEIPIKSEFYLKGAVNLHHLEPFLPPVSATIRKSLQIRCNDIMIMKRGLPLCRKKIRIWNIKGKYQNPT